jgi:monoamine oxidase
MVLEAQGISSWVLPKRSGKTKLTGAFYATISKHTILFFVNQRTVIIIGGGVAGLSAAKKLCSQKKQVVILEARNRLGGRIHTISPVAFPELALECGAEFIHGNLPYTIGLLQEYNIPFHKVEGEMLDLNKENSSAHEGATWNKLLRKMGALKKDMTLSQMLDENFYVEKDIPFKHSIKRFASGFDLADPDLASSMALYREWSEESEDQFRINGGYKKLVDALYNDCLKSGCRIFTSTIASQIVWSKNHVKVQTTNGKVFTASQALVTVPAGVMTNKTKRGFIHFNPSIPEKINAFRDIGYGSVIKILLVFKTAFWESKNKSAGFFFTPHQIPTWWTQAPAKNNLLTGWLGGIELRNWSDQSDETILEASLDSLALSFHLQKNHIKEWLIYSKIVNWSREGFTYGGYSYSTLNTATAKKKLAEPIANTIYFAGEALNDRLMQGTVEAAIQNGMETAERMK